MAFSRLLTLLGSKPKTKTGNKFPKAKAKDLTFKVKAKDTYLLASRTPTLYIPLLNEVKGIIRTAQSLSFTFCQLLHLELKIMLLVTLYVNIIAA